jgi:sugar lactone lactonase YvrE
MVTSLYANLRIDSRDILGEGPVWDGAGGRLIWSDNIVGTIREARPSETGEWREVRQWKPARSLGAAIPRAAGGLIVAAGTELLALSESGACSVFARINADGARVQLNDARCDSKGRLWVGTLAPDFSQGLGALYRVDPDGAVTTMLESVSISNGLDWSPDESTFYFIDSGKNSVDAFDFDGDSGSISRRRTVITFSKGEGVADGMTVDSEGCLWVAVFGSGEVRRFAPDGVLRARVAISAPGVTSCAFGGPDGGDLFITSGSIRLPDAALAKVGFSVEVAEKIANAPGAGGLFVCRPGVNGKPAVPFAG